MASSKGKKNFRNMSDKQCDVKGCEKFLKQEIVDRNPGATKCYKCFMKLVRKNPRSGMGPMSRAKRGL